MADKTFEANIYTPDWKFISVLKDYISIVWTDRYYEAGDFELILPLSKENLQIYAPDNYIVCNQSDKVMIIEQVTTSASAEGYKMKVTGHSAEILLRRRVTPNEIIINRTTNNEVPIEIKTNVNSHFAGALATVFEACFEQDSVEMMSEQNNQEATQVSYESRSMSSIRFAGVISDPFGHIADAIGNIDSHGDEYYDIIQEQCESKDIGFAVYRNFEREIDRSKSSYNQANTSALFDLVLYDGWNQTGDYLVKDGADMDVTMHNKLYQIPSGIIFSVEYLNLQSSDSNYSKENHKNYIFVKGDEINSNSSASVDVAEATANFTEAFTDENAKYYQVGTESESEYGIFRKETFMDSGISRGLNTRSKYASRLKAKGAKELKKQKAKWTLSCEIGNVAQFIYRKDYYLGDLVKVKDSMNSEEIFRVTEEIISCDAAGLKVYPTLVLFDEDKYVADDSLEDVDMSARVLIDFKFNGGKLDRETAKDVYLEAASNFTVSGDKYDKWLWGYNFNDNKVPLATEAGAIIDTIPSVLTIQAVIGQYPTSDNIDKLVNMIEGVRTYQITGNYAKFPETIGTVSNNPSIIGEYNVSKEFYDLRYWMSTRRFIVFEETTGPEEFTEVYGYETFDAHWSPTYYTIIFEHGDGGKYSLSSFVGSYCPITDIEAYSSSPPTWQNGKFYERTRDWNRDSYIFSLLYSMPSGWYTSGSDTYYDKYYMRSNDTDKIYTYCGYKKMPNEPSVFPEIGYRRDSSKWEPTIVPATADATYRAKWKREEEDEEEEEPDEEEGKEAEEKRDSDSETWSPTVHKTDNSDSDAYIGDDETNNPDSFGMGMMCFRSYYSRLFDVFLPKSLLDWKIEKKSDGPDQHSAFLYQRNIGSGCRLQAFWYGIRGMLPGISIIRNSDNAIIAVFSHALSSNYTLSGWPLLGGQWQSLTYANKDKVAEVAFTVAPVVKKIKGFKALTSNPISSDTTEWPQNKIYERYYSGGTYLFRSVNSKPSNWDSGGWRQYYKFTQTGAKYGIYAGAYDDLGLPIGPFWTRAGIVDHPVIDAPFDVTYTSSALDLATYNSNSFARYAWNSTGWSWVEVPDARWKGRKTGTPINPITDNWPEFVYTSNWGALFENVNGGDLVHMPEDWGTEAGSGKYRYKATQIYATLPFRNNLGPQGESGWSPSSYEYYGPGFNGGLDPNLVYIGGSAGLHIPYPKLCHGSNTIWLTVLGYTEQQHVKPGTVATFKVNAVSVILAAEITYDWQTSLNNSGWVSTGVGGSVYSFTASAEQNGMEIRCIVKASYSLLDETMSASETCPGDGTTMLLIVDDEGTDGKDPSTYEEETENLKSNTEPAKNETPYGDAVIDTDKDGNTTAYITYSNGGSRYTKDTYLWTGSGDPPKGVTRAELESAGSDWMPIDSKTWESTSGSASSNSPSNDITTGLPDWYVPTTEKDLKTTAGQIYMENKANDVKKAMEDESARAATVEEYGKTIEQ